MNKADKEFDPAAALGGMLNIFGIKIDIGQLLGSEEGLQQGLGDLREKLKRTGCRESLSDAEWRQKGATVTGYIRARGPFGEKEFHVGTFGDTGKKDKENPPPSDLSIEPPVDVFDEGQQVTIVADVPGTTLEDFVLKVQGNVFILATKPGTRRNYRKKLQLKFELDPDSLQSSCRNGVLEVHLRKRRVQAGAGGALSKKSGRKKRTGGS